MSWQRGISGAFGPVGLEMLQQYLRQLRLMSGLGANSAAACLAAFQVERDQSDRTQALRSCREIQSFLWFLGELPLADRGAVWAMIGEELCPYRASGTSLFDTASRRSWKKKFFMAYVERVKRLNRP